MKRKRKHVAWLMIASVMLAVTTAPLSVQAVSTSPSVSSDRVADSNPATGGSSDNSSHSSVTTQTSSNNAATSASQQPESQMSGSQNNQKTAITQPAQNDRSSNPSSASPQKAAATDLPISFGMKPVKYQTLTFTGQDLQIPVTMSLPKAGPVNFYVMFWWGINQYVGSQTFANAGANVPAVFTIPANVVPRGDSVYTVSIFATDSAGHQTGMTNLVLLSTVGGSTSGALSVVAPGNVNFNQGQTALTVDEAWGKQLPATIEGPQSNTQTGAGDNRLAVLDTFSTKQAWTLTASMAQPLTGPDREPLTDSVFYKRKGANQLIEKRQALVATSDDYATENMYDQHQTVRGRQTNISGRWATDTGLFLEVPFGIGGGNEEYTGTITWTLTNGVANH